MRAARWVWVAPLMAVCWSLGAGCEGGDGSRGNVMGSTERGTSGSTHAMDDDTSGTSGASALSTAGHGDDAGGSRSTTAGRGDGTDEPEPSDVSGGMGGSAGTRGAAGGGDGAGGASGTGSAGSTDAGQNDGDGTPDAGRDAGNALPDNGCQTTDDCTVCLVRRQLFCCPECPRVLSRARCSALTAQIDFAQCQPHELNFCPAISCTPSGEPSCEQGSCVAVEVEP